MLRDIEAIKCLIIDDDEDDFEMANDALSNIRSRPHHADWACDFDAAAEKMAQNEYHVCLVDYRIGAQTGLEFIREAIAGGCRVPMILLTGIIDEQIDEDAAEAGAYDFIEKSAIEPRTIERSIRFSVLLAQQLRKLKENSTLLRVTLEHTGAGIAAFNNAGGLETYNSRLLQILRIEHEMEDQAEPLNSNYELNEDLERRIIENLALFETDAETIFEMEVAEGRIVEVRLNEAPDGRKIVVCTDITARRMVHDELVRSREEALASVEAKTQFLANMSHELRTPLNSIIGYSEFLKIQMTERPCDEKWPEYANFIHASGSHLLSVINDILTLTKIDFGKLDLISEPVSVMDIVSFCEQSLQPLAAAKNQKIDQIFCDDNLAILCDENIMRQALLNLLSNAVKFSGEGGEIRTIVELGPKDEIHITVEDDGIGMSDHELEQCLEPFVQADNSLSRRFEGTGLGLPLVNRYLNMHGGHLDIRSETGMGTSATIVLPAERLFAAARGQTKSAVPAANLSQKPGSLELRPQGTKRA